MVTGMGRGPARKAVFLDRDGVLTVPEFRDGRSYAPRTLEAFRVYDDAATAVRTLRDAGFLTVVVTNQPDVGAGHVPRSVVDAMHDRLRKAVAVDDIEVCCDTRAAATDRRKPGAGMLRDAAARWNIDLAASYMVGDRASDVEAGRAAGCTSLFVDLGYTAEPAPCGQVATLPSLAAAADWILAEEGRRALDVPPVRNNNPGREARHAARQ